MATSNLDDNYFYKPLEENEIINWEPLSLTLVEYPKGNVTSFALFTVY